MAFEKIESSKREESLIPNSQIEIMFMRVCNDSQMKNYTDLIEKGHVSLATAYASNMVYKVFYALVENLEKYGLTVEEIVKRQKKKGKNK